MNVADDLTAKEQANVRTALRFLQIRLRGWAEVNKVLRFRRGHLSHVVGGKAASPTLAFRIAKFAKVPVDDVLTGRFPKEGTCPLCGHLDDESG